MEIGVWIACLAAVPDDDPFEPEILEGQLGLSKSGSLESWVGDGNNWLFRVVCSWLFWSGDDGDDLLAYDYFCGDLDDPCYDAPYGAKSEPDWDQIELTSSWQSRC